MHQPETTYRALFDSIDEGFCIIEVLFEGERPFDYRFLSLNPAFERHSGLTGATGKTVLELVPHQDQHWFERYGRIAVTGEPERFESEGQALGRFFEVYAFRVGQPQQRQVAILFKDVSERKRAEAALRASEELKAYLLKLTDGLRPLSDATAIQAKVTSTARQHFATDRCWYAELHNGRAIIRHDDSRAGLEAGTGQ